VIIALGTGLLIAPTIQLKKKLDTEEDIELEAYGVYCKYC